MDVLRNDNLIWSKSRSSHLVALEGGPSSNSPASRSPPAGRLREPEIAGFVRRGQPCLLDMAKPGTTRLPRTTRWKMDHDEVDDNLQMAPWPARDPLSAPCIQGMNRTLPAADATAIPRRISTAITRCGFGWQVDVAWARGIDQTSRSTESVQHWWQSVSSEEPRQLQADGHGGTEYSAVAVACIDCSRRVHGI